MSKTPAEIAANLLTAADLYTDPRVVGFCSSLVKIAEDLASQNMQSGTDFADQTIANTVRALGRRRQ